MPVYPTPTFQLTGEPFENTSFCVANASGRATTGMRTLRFPSDHVSEPAVYLFSGAVVVVSVTSKLFVSPGASVSVEGLTAIEIPVIDDEAVNVAVLLPTLVTRRFTVCWPARPPSAIDGVFMSRRSSEKPCAASEAHVAGVTPVVAPQRNANQSRTSLS